ncbi:MAG: oligosaccharide flippase family protein [Vicinamibacterales bacterium]
MRHRLLRTSAVYAGSSVARNAIPFLLMPVLTRYLSPTDFGIVATFEVILAMGLVSVGLNMHGAIGVNFFRLEHGELGIYVGNVILVSVITSVVTLGLALLVFHVFSLEIPAASTRWLPLIALAALAQVLFSIALTLWQVEERPIPYAIFQTLQTALNVGLSLLFVVAFSWGWRGRLLAIITASVAFGAISLFIVHRRWRRTLEVRTEYLKDALAFGVPLVPHSLGNWILTGIDRLFLTSMVGVAATGVYTVGYQVGMIVGLVATSFNQAWSPFLFQKLKEDNPHSKIRIVRFTYLYIVAIAVFALILSLAAPWFLSVFVGPEFRGAYRYVMWVALGYAANGMYLMVAHYIFYAKKTHLLAAVTFFAAIVNIVLNYVLIRANGPIGAAQASAASFFVSFVLTWLLAARVYKMPWRIWNDDGTRTCV